MSRDRLDDLAAQLFAAARDEAPDPALVERVQRATVVDAAASEQTLEGPRPRAHRRREPAVQLGRLAPDAAAPASRRRLSALVVRGLLAAIVGGGLAAVLLLPRAHDGVLISAERSPSGGAAAPGSMPSAGRAASGAPSGSLASTGEGELSRGDALSRGEAPSGELSSREMSSHAAAPDAPSSPEAAAASVPRRTTDSPAPSPLGEARGASPSPRADTPATSRPGAATPPRAPSPARSSTFSDELGVIKQIRQALRGNDGPGALALLDRYDGGEYGKSLSLEASVLRLEALDAVGRRSEAEVLARRFVRENPDSPLAERAQRFIDRAGPAQPAPERAPR